jgi:tetratricopeptide (TPR) repeat protein
MVRGLCGRWGIWLGVAGGLVGTLLAGAMADIVTFRGGDQLYGEIYRQDREYIAMRLVTGGDVVVGREFVRSVVREPPEDFNIKRGDYYLSRREYAQALSEYLLADQRKPGQNRIQAKIGEVKRLRSEEICGGLMRRADELLTQGAYRGAIGTLLDAARECPEGPMHGDVLRQLALLQSQLAYHYFNHCFEELALEELAKAWEYDPLCANSYFVLGRIYHAQSRYRTARREYQRALELDPTLELARNSLLRLEKDARRIPRLF